MDNAKHYDDAAIALIESRCKSNTHRIDELQEHQSALDRLVTSVEVLATKQETVEGDVKEIKEDVKTITGKAGKRWDSLVDNEGVDTIVSFDMLFSPWIFCAGFIVCLLLNLFSALWPAWKALGKDIVYSLNQKK